MYIPLELASEYNKDEVFVKFGSLEIVYTGYMWK